MKQLLFLFVVVYFSLPAKAQKIDTSPLDAYWKMIEPLKKGDSLSSGEWEKFLQIEANHVYVTNQGFDSGYLERLRKNIEFVYMPQYDSLLQARLKAIQKDPSSYWLTFKVNVYRENEAALKAYEKQLLSPAYLDSMYANAWQWLPKNLRKKDSAVTFYLLGIENDAIAGNGTIIATLWSIYNQDKLRTGILAGHEMHHVLRKGVELKAVSENDKGIIYVLNSILNEGSADMVDKNYAIAHDDELPWGSKFKDFVLFQADSIVQQIDSSLLLMAASQGKEFKTERQYRDLIRWSSGHCPGYYMANIIVRNGFKKQLLENIRNPFYFVYLYNKAAKKDLRKPSLFSAASISYIKEMEKKYLPSAKKAQRGSL